MCATIAPFQAGAEQAAQALAAGRLDLPDLLAAQATGDPTGVEAAAESAEVAPLTLRVLLDTPCGPPCAPGRRGCSTGFHWTTGRLPSARSVAIPLLLVSWPDFFECRVAAIGALRECDACAVQYRKKIDHRSSLCRILIPTLTISEKEM